VNHCDNSVTLNVKSRSFHRDLSKAASPSEFQITAK
jgi:hypothetical protein